MRTDFDDFAPSITNLRNLLGNASLLSSAADVYASAFPKPWQTIYGDMNWDVAADPGKSSSLGDALVPGSYIGRARFIRMVNETQNLIALLLQSYNRQESLLNQIDTKIQTKAIYGGESGPQVTPIKEITDYLKFNIYEQERIDRNVELLQRVPINLTKMNKTMGGSPMKVQGLKSFITLMDANVRVYKGVMVTELIVNRSLKTLVASLKSLMMETYVQLDKLQYLLIIVEEAVSKAQEDGAQPGDLVKY